MCQIDLVAALSAVEEGQRILRKKVTSRLKEAPRRRKTVDTQVRELYKKLNPDLRVEEE